MTSCCNLPSVYNDISTHILTKRMTPANLSQSALSPYFNSHPHEEDDVNTTSRLAHFGISTHILTKRMTTSLVSYGGSGNISTHILTKRMTAILNKNNLFKIAYYISNKHFISIVDIFFHFHIYF